MSGYVETELCFTERGREIVFRYDPARMHPYSLAKALKFNKPWKREPYETAFGERTSHVVDDAFKTQRFPARLNSDERRALEENRDITKKIWKASPVHIAKLVLENRGPLVYERDVKGETKIRAVNRAVFNQRLLQIAIAYITGEAGQNAVRDYKTVQEALKDSSRFDELEQLCEGALRRFMTNGRVFALDPESQLQEGRMVVWQCAQKYDARNFARFNTMVRAALHNKTADLIRYFTADKRRVQKMTFAMGAGEEGSRLREHLDDRDLSAWVSGQRISLYGEDLADAEFDPFFSFVEYPEQNRKTSEFEAKYAIAGESIDDVGDFFVELDDTTRPVGLEKRVGVVSKADVIDHFSVGRVERLEAWRKECRRKAILNNPLIKDKQKLLDNLDRTEVRYGFGNL